MTRRMTERSRRVEALALLGLARRAGALAKGTDAARVALRRGEARLLILADDGSEAQREKVLPLARSRNVPWVSPGSRAQIGAAVGAGPLTALAVTEDGFARRIREMLGRN
jgi:ribosomal protein L7Ae-like RNA K-turn-binding protein